MVKYFISFTGADREWATWIAWQVEALQHKVRYQEWDFLPGNDFVAEMERAAEECDHTIAVLSPNYLRSSFARSEWRAAFARDPDGTFRRLIPIRVVPLVLPSFFNTRIYIDVVDLSEDDAKMRIQEGLGDYRRKPSFAPNYPGDRHAPQYPGRAGKASSTSIDSHQVVRYDESTQFDPIGSLSIEIETALRAGDFGLTIKSARRSVAIEPSNAWANLLLASALLSGTDVAAIETRQLRDAESALMTAMSDDSLRGPALVLLGILKHDGYRVHGLREKPPTFDEISSELINMDIDPRLAWIFQNVDASPIIRGTDGYEILTF